MICCVLSVSMSMQYSHCYCLLPIVVKSKPMISKLHLVSTQKFVWHACIVCVRFQGDKGILSFCLYDCLCLCAQLYQTTIIQRDVCPVCVEQPQPRQTMPHWVPHTQPSSLGRGHENDVSLSLNHQLFVQAHNCDLRKWRLGRLLFRSAQEVA